MVNTKIKEVQKPIRRNSTHELLDQESEQGNGEENNETESENLANQDQNIQMNTKNLEKSLTMIQNRKNLDLNDRCMFSLFFYIFYL